MGVEGEGYAKDDRMKKIPEIPANIPKTPMIRTPLSVEVVSEFNIGT